MKFYCYLRAQLNLPPWPAALLTGLWFGTLLFLSFLGLAMLGMDFRYANL